VCSSREGVAGLSNDGVDIRIVSGSLQSPEQQAVECGGLTAVRPSTIRCNAGMTIHSMTGIGVPKFVEDFEMRMTWKADGRGSAASSGLREVEVLIVDEVSMVSAEFFELVERAWRKLRSSPWDKQPQPFGGVQVIAVGDFCQCDPTHIKLTITLTLTVSSLRETTASGSALTLTITLTITFTRMVQAFWGVQIIVVGDLSQCIPIRRVLGLCKSCSCVIPLTNARAYTTPLVRWKGKNTQRLACVGQP
jgi:hypothetical protein